MPDANAELVINKVNKTTENKILIAVVFFSVFMVVFFYWLFSRVIGFVTFAILLFIVGLIAIGILYTAEKNRGRLLSISDEILSSVGADLKEFDKKERGDMFEILGYRFVKNWFICSSSTTFRFFNIRDIKWVHTSATKHSTNFVPTGTSHGITIHLSSGASFTRDYGYGESVEKNMQTKLAELRKIAPWAVYGWSPQLQALWNQDKVRFVVLVEQNWQQILQQYWQQQKTQQQTWNTPTMPVSRYYEILGLKSTATKEQIKEAYRKMAKKYHPDISKSKHAQEKMQEINEAYSLLTKQ